MDHRSENQCQPNLSREDVDALMLDLVQANLLEVVGSENGELIFAIKNGLNSKFDWMHKHTKSHLSLSRLS